MGLGVLPLAESTVPNDAAKSRASRNLAWFLKKHAGHMARMEAKQPQIDLMTAENWIMRDALTVLYKDYISAGLSTKSLSYADGLGGDPALLQATAEFFNRHFKPVIAVKPEHIVTGAGCSAILDNMLYDVCDRGDGVLVEAPFWESGPTDRSSRAETFIAAYEEALASSKCPIKALLFCNPHNPRGDLYPREHIEALLQFCETHDIHFISDEIYGLSTFHDGGRENGPGFVSVLECDLKKLNVDPARVHIIYSISKDMGSSGLRLGFLVTQAHPDLRLSLAISNHSKVSTLTSTVATALLSNKEGLDEILAESRIKLAASAGAIMDFLSHHGFKYIRPLAGIFIWARLGTVGCTWEEERELSRKLQMEGASLGAGGSYCAIEPGWFRITFALPTPVMNRAMRVIEDALGLTNHWEPEVQTRAEA
ncbi:putative secondary metabolism biosynthetic enzyme [Trichoderma virens FT-333]|nr:putative secondary metabolism biosynthetic enzyme [Trichoderma virens FT-333]